MIGIKDFENYKKIKTPEFLVKCTIEYLVNSVFQQAFLCQNRLHIQKISVTIKKLVSSISQGRDNLCLGARFFTV